jgi:hypothetical protein
MHHPSLKQESKRTRRMMMRVTRRGAEGFQDPKNVINVIFGGDGGFPSKCIEVDPVRNPLCRAGHAKASEIQRGLDLLL